MVPFISVIFHTYVFQQCSQPSLVYKSSRYQNLLQSILLDTMTISISRIYLTLKAHNGAGKVKAMRKVQVTLQVLLLNVGENPGWKHSFFGSSLEPDPPPPPHFHWVCFPASLQLGQRTNIPQGNAVIFQTPLHPDYFFLSSHDSLHSHSCPSIPF